MGAGADPFAPTGSVGRAQSVDGLIVGHRLMAAGEYELAIKAYLRAAGEIGTTVDVLSALGSANLQLGRLGQAEDLLRKAVKKDETFVPAWNNLGVVLMERQKPGEASRVFQTAFALDSGNSDEIRQNLQRALAQIENPAYTSEKSEAFDLVRRGNGRYLILATP
ncbi:tetratricopeptide repeat protein [uncultured Litoreibacter sp.]|uniref:tetratricopeptide repeat protein n=1 Tax=uncultured Litoreibacter sp. TaxID=1392394 RepID=UPI002615C4B7|nr:tetratricopeptide repeat protein [uncultured Litoreibacter sp.]